MTWSASAVHEVFLGDVCNDSSLADLFFLLLDLTSDELVFCPYVLIEAIVSLEPDLRLLLSKIFFNFSLITIATVAVIKMITKTTIIITIKIVLLLSSLLKSIDS